MIYINVLRERDFGGAHDRRFDESQLTRFHILISIVYLNQSKIFTNRMNICVILSLHGENVFVGCARRVDVINEQSALNTALIRFKLYIVVTFIY